MKRLLAAALTAGIVTVSCSGHGASSAIPTAGAGQSAAKSGPALKRQTIATAPLGWAATGTQAIALANAADLGPVPASQSITVRLGLQLRNVQQLKSLVASHQTVSHSTFMTTYAPTSEQVQQLKDYLQSEGFTGVSAEPNNLIVSATGTAAQAQHAFNTTLHSFSQNGLTVYANSAPAYVPQQFAGSVVAVLGLSNAQAMAAKPNKGGPHPAPSPSATPAPAPTPTAAPEQPCSLNGLELVGLPTPVPEPSSPAGCLRNYAPADYWRAYDAMNVPAAANVSVAIMTAGQLGDAVQNLRVNEQTDGLVQVPVVVKQVGVPGGVISSAVDEWTLDMTASSGMARALKTLYVYNTTSLSDSDITLMYNHWAADDLAPIGNSSFGGCEAFPFLDGSMLIDDEIFLQAASQGQTMFASSGDTGSFCPVGTGVNGVPAGAPMVSYPASSPYVTAVGGTTLVTQSAGSYQGEASWYSGGGGISAFEGTPSWATVQPQGRGVPDIAMDGDLQTGMVLYDADAGGWITIGGTSLSSPLAAGVWARMLQTHPSAGFAPPQLYANFTSHTAGAQVAGPPPWQPDGGFHDILAGANGAYTALPGYDYTTGLGSIDAGTLSGEL